MKHRRRRKESFGEKVHYGKYKRPNMVNSITLSGIARNLKFRHFQDILKPEISENLIIVKYRK